jgi:hypothetical protein
MRGVQDATPEDPDALSFDIEEWNASGPPAARLPGKKR